MTSYGEPLPVDGGSEDTWGEELLALWNAAPTYTERLQGSLAINAPIDAQAEYVVYDSRFPFDVKRVSYQCLPSGTADLSFKINAVNIGGLSSVGATATKSTSSPSGTNSVVVGDNVTVTATNIDASVERIVIGVWGDRTGAGTAA